MKRTFSVVLSLVMALSLAAVLPLSAAGVENETYPKPFIDDSPVSKSEDVFGDCGEPALYPADGISGIEDASTSVAPADTVLASTLTDTCHVAVRSAYEIRNYVNAHPFYTSAAATYEQTPDLYNNRIGKLSSKTLNEALNALNVMRYIAGLSEVTLDRDYTELAQAASFVNCANNQMSHYPVKPPAVSQEIYELGAKGASSSNLGRGYNNPADSIIRGYMEDSDSSNIDRVGHRRWCLNPSMAKTGFGQADRRDSGRQNSHTAMYAFDHSNGDANEYNVSWPAQVMPIEYFGSNYAWSISTNQYVSNATVKLTRVSDGRVWSFGNNYSDGYFNINNGGYGQTGCIIFRPNNVGGYKNGDLFNVRIEGQNGLDISYTVYFFSLNSYTSGACYHNNLINIPDASATCTRPGTIAHSKCSNCGKLFIGGREVTSREVVIPASGHSVGEWLGNVENHWHICSVCDKKCDIDIHSWDEGKEIGTDSGIKIYKCKVCKRTKAESTCNIIDSGYCGYEGYGYNLEWMLTENGTMVISGIGRMRSYWVYYEHKDLIKSIIIADGVTNIADWVFSYCANLTSVEIPSSVTSIGEFAFNSCTSLNSITIPHGVISIGDSAFSSCSKLSTVKMSSGVASIGDSAFSHCYSLLTIDMPRSIVSIGKWAFSYCRSLSSITIPRRVASIGEYAFYGNNSLTTIEIPKSVVSIGSCAFCSCANLTDIYCEAESQPGGWDKEWNVCPDAEVHWGCEMSIIIICGDVDDDDKVTAKDRVTLARYLAGWDEYKDINEAAADVDNDGRITAKDRVTLARHIAGWAEYIELPCNGK